MFCKLEENLKQNNQKPWHRKLLLWWDKSKDTICPPNFLISLRSFIPRKRLEQQKNKQDPALNPPQQYSTMVNTLRVSSTIKVLAQVDIQRNISPDFVMRKVPRRDCYKSVSFKHSHKEWKGLVLSFHF